MALVNVNFSISGGFDAEINVDDPHDESEIKEALLDYLAGGCFEIICGNIEIDFTDIIEDSEND